MDVEGKWGEGDEIPMNSKQRNIRGTLKDEMMDAIKESVETGGDLSLATKGIVLEVLKESREISTETLDAIVKTTAKSAGDVASAAKGAVQGAIEGASEMGLDVEEAASRAATGAVKAAYEISSEVGTKVRNIVTGTISGFKVVLKEPFRSEKKKSSHEN